MSHRDVGRRRRIQWFVCLACLSSIGLYACNAGNNSTGTSAGGGGAASNATVTYRSDNARTGQNLHETILTPANVNPSQFGLLFTYPVDGQIHGQPLYVPGVAMGNQIHNVVFVVTAHDSVYAFDADNPLSAPLWQTSFINPTAGVTSVPISDYTCNELFPEVGIVSTPVIDPVRGILYAVAFTKESGNYLYRLHAVNLATGADLNQQVIQGAVPGTGDGSDGTNVSFDPFQHKQRAALLLSNGMIYVAFASNCDTPPYHGWLFGYDASTLQPRVLFNDTPNGSDGGIWNGGPAADLSGNLFLITGNGTFDGSAGHDWGDSFLRLAANLTVLDFFTPFNQSDLAANDLDLGSSSPLLLPDQSTGPAHLLVGGGKEGRIYLVNRDNMGQFQATDDSRIVQEITGQLASGSEGSLFTGPAHRVFRGEPRFGQSIFSHEWPAEYVARRAEPHAIRVSGRRTRDLRQRVGQWHPVGAGKWHAGGAACV